MRGTQNTFFRISALFMAGSLLMFTDACVASRISGTYVNRASNVVNMLQLTQANSGQITGVLDSIEVKPDGRLVSSEEPITGGTLDGDQLTLTINSSVFGTNMAGVAKGSTIHLQMVGHNGSVLSWDFQRSSPTEFAKCVDDLKFKAGGILQDANLQTRSQGLRQTVQNAERWIGDAELHTQRIPRVKDYYGRIEQRMQSLVARERTTPNLVARSQLSVAVNQYDVQGTQLDIEVNQLWDNTIGTSGQSISQNFAAHLGRCWPGTGEQFRKQGASAKAIGEWESACREGSAEQARFEPVLKRTLAQRADLKTFQESARLRRQELLRKANGLD